MGRVRQLTWRMHDPVVDRDLLRAFVLENSEPAFAQLVDRYVGLVFGTAVRLASHEQAAQEISQEVFIELARKAPRLSGEVMVGGWLYQTTVFKARQWWRTEERRKRREEIAAEIQNTMNDESSSLSSIRQILDEALLELGQKERDALLLRFVENCTQREVGRRLGIKEDAARKRISKGLEQLLRFFSRRGFNVSGAVAATLLGGMSAAIPQNLSAQIVSAALHTGAVVAPSSAGLLLARLLSWNTPRAILCSAFLFLPPLVWEGTRIQSERARNIEVANCLNLLLSELSAAEKELASVTDQMAGANRSAGQLKAEQQHRAVLANTIPGGTNPLLFRWSEASSYVRLPKQLFNHIQLYDSEMDGGDAGGGRRFSTLLTRQGQISGMTLDALGANTSQKDQVVRAFANFAEQYADLESHHTTLTNPDPSQTVGDGNDPMIVVANFANDCAPLKTKLHAEISAALGRERTDALWRQCRSVFRDTFNDFGERERKRILRRFPGQSMVFIEEVDDGHRTHGLAIADLPEAFQSFVKREKKEKESQ
jgi:RNA polymerase sigma factor (sigma-70 family)